MKTEIGSKAAAGPRHTGGSGPLRLLNAAGRHFLNNGSSWLKLEEGPLLDKACEQTGLDDYGDESFREPLQILLNSFEKDADLNLVGRLCVRSEVLRQLCNRLHLTEDRKRHPAIMNETIRRPIFITGLPRTGTTFLHALLAQDPSSRAPRVWEVMYPSPPPERASFDSDPRIARTERELMWIHVLMPEFESAHLIHARLPQECIAIMGHAFMSHVFESMYHVSSYRLWHDGQDKRPAYEFHRQFLQHLQWRCPGAHWVLKAPSHLMALGALLHVYPDAEIVMTHRDPLKVLPSCASFSTILRGPFTHHLDREALGVEVVLRWEEAARSTIALREGNGELARRFYDVQYSDLERDPLGVARGIYAHFGRKLTESAQEAMRRFIRENPKNKKGVHRYSLEEFGLDRTAERRRFLFYTDHFAIEQEA